MSEVFELFGTVFSSGKALQRGSMAGVPRRPRLDLSLQQSTFEAECHKVLHG